MYMYIKIEMLRHAVLHILIVEANMTTFNNCEVIICFYLLGICADDQFVCPADNKCISNTWLCDGDDDCGDASDEAPGNCAASITSMFLQ